MSDGAARYLTVNKCPLHGFYSVSVDDDCGGVRLTPEKCCGRWDVIRRWPMTHAMAEEIVNEIQCAMDDRGGENG